MYGILDILMGIPCYAHDLRFLAGAPLIRNITAHLLMYSGRFFMQNQWSWDIKEQDTLMAAMSDTDRKTFNVDIRHMNW